MFEHLFTRASKSTVALNPHIFDAGRVAESKPERPQHEEKMTRPESSYALLLEAMRARGDAVRWLFHPFTLRWLGMRYTPDFCATLPHESRLRVIEGQS